MKFLRFTTFRGAGKSRRFRLRCRLPVGSRDGAFEMICTIVARDALRRMQIRHPPQARLRNDFIQMCSSAHNGNGISSGIVEDKKRKAREANDEKSC